jgi:hypothetical protein
MSEPRRWRGVWGVWPAVLGVVVHFVLREMLNPWLNAPSDAKFWGAVLILAVPIVFAVVALIRSIAPPPQR